MISLKYNESSLYYLENLEKYHQRKITGKTYYVNNKKSRKTFDKNYEYLENNDSSDSDMI